MRASMTGKTLAGWCQRVWTRSTLFTHPCTCAVAELALAFAITKSQSHKAMVTHEWLGAGAAAGREEEGCLYMMIAAELMKWVVEACGWRAEAGGKSFLFVCFGSNKSWLHQSDRCINRTGIEAEDCISTVTSTMLTRMDAPAGRKGVCLYVYIYNIMCVYK